MGFTIDEIKSAENAADIGGRSKLSPYQLESLYKCASTRRWETPGDEIYILSLLKDDYELFLFQLFKDHPGELELLRCYTKWQRMIIKKRYAEEYNQRMNRGYQTAGLLIICFLGSLVGGGVLIGKYFI